MRELLRSVHLLPAVLLLLVTVRAAELKPPEKNAAAKKEQRKLPELKKAGPANVKVLQLIQVNSRQRNYPYGLSTLLRYISDKTSIKLDSEPDIVNSFADPAIFNYPFIYVNGADRPDWNFTRKEKKNIRKYLMRGGFVYIDAGISASFLRQDSRYGQHHSFAEWEERPVIRDAFKSVFPTRKFRPLKRSHPIYRSFYKGLPDPATLPDTVRNFVVKEKWPQGSYSAVALTLNQRVAVLCTPIIAMGWGRNYLGNWATTIGFRIRESAKDLGAYLDTAAYSGQRFETRREDGAKDIVYCQERAVPAWVHEPGDRWRVFRYYHSREISEFAHVFYTQLGVNFMVYALTH